MIVDLNFNQHVQNLLYGDMGMYLVVITTLTILLSMVQSGSAGGYETTPNNLATALISVAIVK